MSDRARGARRGPEPAERESSAGTLARPSEGVLEDVIFLMTGPAIPGLSPVSDGKRASELGAYFTVPSRFRTRGPIGAGFHRSTPVDDGPQESMMEAGFVKLGWSRATVMSFADRITVNPNQCGGRPCIRGMRIRVKDVLDLMAARVPESEILEDYPDLEPEDIQACIEYAAAQLDHPVFPLVKR